jgi:DNA-binding transcriptional ArsR family regulator
MSQELLMVDSVAQAAVMLKPLRVAMLREMGEQPRSCPELATTFDATPQKMYYHVKTLEAAGLVERAGERLVNGIAEGFYRARAQSYWLSPKLVRRLGGKQAVRDQTSLGMLAGHAEELLEDVARLAGESGAGEHVPSLSLGVEIALPDVERRSAFLEELRTTFEALARRYSVDDGSVADADHDKTAAEGGTFRFTLACYPKLSPEAT